MLFEERRSNYSVSMIRYMVMEMEIIGGEEITVELGKFDPPL